MAEPTVTCPNCKTEIKLTESLAARLLEATRRDFEKLAGLFISSLNRIRAAPLMPG